MCPLSPDPPERLEQEVGSAARRMGLFISCHAESSIHEIVRKMFIIFITMQQALIELNALAIWITILGRLMDKHLTKVRALYEKDTLYCIKMYLDTVLDWEWTGRGKRPCV